MKKISVIKGVVAEYNNKFWGTQYKDQQCIINDFGDFEKAMICDPKYCIKPTDMTNFCNPEYVKLQKAKLVKVKKTITIDFQILT
jgi:hypothetical protein